MVGKIFIRLLLIVSLLPLQACTNTLIGKKLEDSFDSTNNSKTLIKSSNTPKKTNQKSEIKSRIQEDIKVNENDLVYTTKANPLSNGGRLTQKPIKSIKKTIFDPQPYRIIIKLSGANPSAPAETVTEALREAGVQFEVEKIERFYEENFSKDASLKR